MPRPLNRPAIAWLIALILFAVLWVWVFLSDEPAVWITKRDMTLMDPITRNRVGWLDSIMRFVNDFGTHWATPMVGWTTLVGALALRRVRHALLLLGALTVVAGATVLVANQIGRPRPLGTEIIGKWDGFAQPSRPVAMLAVVLVAAGLSFVPARARRGWFWACFAVVSLFGFAQVYTGVEHPTDVFAGATAGVAITLALYRLFAPEEAFPITYRRGPSAHVDIGGARGEAIRDGLRSQLSITPTVIEPVGWESSAGSTPLRIETEQGQIYFGKLYTSTHLRSDRSYKVVRALLYGQLEDEKSFSSVRRLVQHEDYMLHVMNRVGVACAKTHGIVEITPEREYLLVTEFIDDATEIGEADVDDEVIEHGLRQIEILWRAGLAHRDIKPGNVMVQHRQVRMVDVAFAEVRPSPWRQAVDLANMMLVLALRSSAEQVYGRARARFTDDEIAEAFAAARGVTMPRRLRAELRRDGRDLLGQFRALAPQRRPVTIQRWSVRRVGLMLWFTALAAFIVVTFMSGLDGIGLLP